MISPEKCIGCRSCELICSFTKTQEFNPRHAAVSVMSYDEALISVPMMCMQCEEPACMKVCPVGAITKSDYGAIVIDDKKCIVCKLCASACPLGNISFAASERKMIKCDLCGGEPRCEQFCPSGAIRYQETTSSNLNRKRIIAEKLKELFGEVGN